jgi:fructose-1,6-bisphosphatase/sedoheptulose 1,7-bisphosphatase-like protein
MVCKYSKPYSRYMFILQEEMQEAVMLTQEQERKQEEEEEEEQQEWRCERDRHGIRFEELYRLPAMEKEEVCTTARLTSSP